MRSFTMDMIRYNREAVSKLLETPQWKLLGLHRDRFQWIALLVKHPMSNKRLSKMLHLMVAALRENNGSKAVGIMFSILTDHLLTEAHRLGLPQVMINKVVSDRKWARIANKEYKEKYTNRLRRNTKDLIEAVLEHDELELGGKC